MTAMNQNPLSDPGSSPSTPRPGASGVVLDATERWTGLMIGLADVVTGYSHRTLEAALAAPASDPEHPQAPTPAAFARVIPGALSWLALRAQQRVFDAVAEVETAITEQAAKLGIPVMVGPIASWLYGWLAQFDAEFKMQQSRHAQVASTFLADAGPQTLAELLARVDFEELLADVDMNALLEQVDMDAVMQRIDMDAVFARLDVDAALERVDLDRIMARVDVNELMSGVIKDVQVADLLRDSTGVITNSTVGALRTQVEGMAGLLARRQL